MLATLSKLSLMDPTLSTGIIGKSIADVQARHGSDDADEALKA
jgi:hypothetical protein